MKLPGKQNHNPAIKILRDSNANMARPVSRMRDLQKGTADSMKRPLHAQLLPRSYFLDQLRLEKRRSDRTKAPVTFVLIHFTPPNREEIGKIKQFLEFIHKNIRETDSLGYINEGTIGLLLPHTGADGARKLVKKVTDGYAHLNLTIRPATYPDELFEEFSDAPGEIPDAYPLFLDDPAQARPVRYRLKRVIDIMGSIVGLILLSPLMLLAAVAVKLDSKGPIIFKQIRMGQRGRPFVFYKLRSMVSDSDDRIHREYVDNLIRGNLKEINQGDKDKPLYKIKNDPRVTRVGALLRKLSIDEIPQLFNVLKGEMSLVGPRPPLPYETKAYQAWHLRRILEMKPGITGLWQVSGRSSTTFDEMVRLDVRYIQEWSLLLDLKILLKTIKVVLWPRGAL
jgi:exopolysaccharide biosynthesis polyprenyl glycosylphosphotransferase